MNINNHPLAMKFSQIIRAGEKYPINLHSNELNEFILRQRMKKSKRVPSRLNSKRICKVPASSSTSKIFLRAKKRLCGSRKKISNTFKKDYYEYEATVDGYKYGAWLWAREEDEKHLDYDSDKAWEFEVSFMFMYKLQSGLFIKERLVSPIRPCFYTGSRSNQNNLIPVGLAALIRNLGIPDNYRDAMFRDASCFAHETINSRRRITLCMQIQISILQLKEEDVLETRFRCRLEGSCRSIDIMRMFANEKYLQALIIQEHYATASNCMDMDMDMDDVKEEGGDSCSICLEELRGCYYYILPCSHVYHYHCLFKWVSNTNLCPLCRHPYCRKFPPVSIYPSLTYWSQTRCSPDEYGNRYLY